MALEQLQAARDLVLDGDQVGFFGSHPRWHDELGIVGFASDGVLAYQYSLGQLDGVCHVRNNNPSAFLPKPLGLDLQSDYLLWWNTTDVTLWTWDAVTGNPVELIGTGFDFADFSFVRLPDRFLMAGTGYVRTKPLAGGSTVVEYHLTGGDQPNQASGRMSDMGGGIVGIGFENGDCFAYDWVHQVQVGRWKSIGLANRGLWYSRRFGIWIAVHVVSSFHWTLSIWADETRPAAVSVPAALSAVKKGFVSPIRVQVTGAQGEPVPALPVDWTLPTPGGGSLGATQSLTDADGYAIVDYIAPNTTGSMTIQAAVRF